MTLRVNIIKINSNNILEFKMYYLSGKHLNI